MKVWEKLQQSGEHSAPPKKKWGTAAPGDQAGLLALSENSLPSSGQSGGERGVFVLFFAARPPTGSH